MGDEAGYVSRGFAQTCLCALLVASLVALAGCQAAGPGGGPGTGVEHVVVAEPTDVPAGNASTVNASTPRLADADAVQDALARAAAENGTAVVQVSAEQFAAVNGTVAAMPAATTPAGDEAVEATLYVAYEDTVYRVTVRKRWLV